VTTLANAKVLVTGASGFYGANVSRRLLDLAGKVYGVTRSTRLAQDGGIHWLQGDLRDLETTRSVLRTTKPDVIFHLAGVANAKLHPEMVLPTLQDNLMATVNLLQAAESVNGCRRIVLTGSLEEPTAKLSSGAPVSPYAASKWASSMYARMFHHCYGTPVVIVRPFMTYGPRQKKDKVIPYTILSLLNDQSPRIRNGHRLVDWIYIDDVVEGILMAAQRDGVEGSTVDLGSGVCVTTRDIIERVANIVSARTNPVFDESPENPMQDAKAADTAGAYQTLGWRPLTSLSSGLEQTVNWYRTECQA
jgi:nucleoside-diphosphate-sugar epimerase